MEGRDQMELILNSAIKNLDMFLPFQNEDVPTDVLLLRQMGRVNVNDTKIQDYVKVIKTRIDSLQDDLNWDQQEATQRDAEHILKR